MDTAFLLDEPAARTNFLRLLMQSFGCTYICLWSYSPPPSNCLCFWDGYYHEENNQPSSSSGSLARRLFEEYQHSVFNIQNAGVPGLAFKNGCRYIELNELELQRSASTEIQRQFYKEARIKTAVFMGCKFGEIELGFSNVQINLEMEMKKWFPEDFSRQSPAAGELPQPTDPNRPSSSSSSLRSLSIDSPEYSIFSIPTPISHIQESLNEVPSLLQPILPTTTSSHQQAMQAIARIRNIQLPTPESEDAAMTRAILAVLTSPSSSSSTSPHQPRQNLPYGYHLNPKASAFKNYKSTLAPTAQIGTNLRRQSMLKRAISYCRSLNLVSRERMPGSRPPTSTQLHHMISERKRREKINESFQSLKSLLPPGTKKDKATLLITARECISSLNVQVAELIRRTQILEAQLLPAKVGTNEEASVSSSERLVVRVTHVSEPSSEERIIDLRVSVRGECPVADLAIRILEFLKQVQNVNLMSMEANTHVVESSLINRVTLRLRIEGNEWDESAFEEAVRRVVADLAQ